MTSIKIIHTADWHFDCKFSGINSQKIRLKRKYEQRETFKNVIKLALQENIDLFLIAGDLFEQNSFNIETINFIISALSELKCPVLITPGNHDPYIEKSPYKLHDWGAHVHIFNENEFKPFYYKNVEIYGIADTRYKSNKNCLESLSFPPDDDRIRIIIFHGTCLDFAPLFAEKDICFPFSSTQLENLNAQYIALGHLHQFRQIPIHGINSYYSGTPEGINFSENDSRYIIKAEFDLNCSKIENIKVNQRDFKKHKIDISEINNVTSLYEKIAEKISKNQDTNNLLHIALNGIASFEFNLSELENQLSSEFFYIRLENTTIPFFNLDELKKLNTLIGDFIRKMEEKISNTSSMEEKNIYNKALWYGLKALLGKEEIELT